MNHTTQKSYGCGVGLRSQHYPFITENWPAMDWFEAITENYMDSGGKPVRILEKVRARYPIALHGTALSIGSMDPLHLPYLERLKKLVERIDPFIVSDHLCWSGINGETLHDLLPLPFTEESVKHITERIQQVQDLLKCRILLENVSSYLTFRHSTMSEWDFLSEIARRSGCGILLDVNNVYVNAVNHGFDAYAYVRAIPPDLVKQIHVAGHTNMGNFLFDTHSAPALDEVWDLYRETLKLCGQVPTLIEWDEHIPEFDRLSEEAGKARVIYNKFGQPAKVSERAMPTAAYHVQTAGVNSPELSNVQSWFRDEMRRVVSSHLPIELNPQGGEPGKIRIEVYANGYSARVRESIKEVYETVRQIAGHEAFDDMACAYAESHKSLSYNLNDAGLDFPEFLSAHEWGKKNPLWIQLAEFERLIWKAFHAFDETPVSAGELQNITFEEWENAKVVFQPSVCLYASRWPVFDLWRCRNDEKALKKVDLADKPQKIMIGRNKEQVRCEIIDETQHLLIKGLLSGQSLGSVCEVIAETTESSSIPVAQWFARWIHDGLITRLTFTESVNKSATA